MQESNGSDRRRIVLAVLVVLALIAGGVFVATRESSAAASVRLVGADESGPDPFTASVGPAVTLPGNVRAIASTSTRGYPTDRATDTRSAVGTEVGLYGGSNDARSCDPQKLVAFLGANRAKARAWASVMGVSPLGIEQYVATLTPLVLVRDTLVTNHGFKDGSARAFQAVLEAGTAVLVDQRGVPRVKCGCGNPLTPPASESLAEAEIVGSPWPGYEPSKVTRVRPGRPTDRFEVIDVETGDTVDFPVGGSQDVFVHARTADQETGDTSTIATSADGRTWDDVATVPDQVKGLAFGAGRWIAVVHVGQEFNARIITSRDLENWTTVTEVAGTDLRAVTYGDGRWVAVGMDRGGATISTSTDGEQWTPSTRVDGAPGVYPTGVAFGQDRFLAVGGQGSRGLPVLLESSDGLGWKASSATVDARTTTSVGFGRDEWTIGGDGWYSSPDARTWTRDSGEPGPVGYAYANGRWLAASVSGGGLGPDRSAAGSTVSASTDGRSWSTVGEVDGAVLALAAGTRVVSQDATNGSEGQTLGAGTFILAATGYEGCSPTNPLSTMNVVGSRVTIPVDGVPLTGTIVARSSDGSFVANANAADGTVNVTLVAAMTGDGGFTADGTIVRREAFQACQPQVTGTPAGDGGDAKSEPEASCDIAGVEAALSGRRLVKVNACIDGWAAVGVVIGGEGDEASVVVRRDGGRWVRVSCDEPAVPAAVLLVSCMTG